MWQTGQKISYKAGDDGDNEEGAVWPSPRFTVNAGGTGATDQLTGLMWARDASTPTVPTCAGGAGGEKNWQEALDYVLCLNQKKYLGYSDWRLPNRHELHSLTDFSQFNPALPSGHPFTGIAQYLPYPAPVPYYWSSSTHNDFSLDTAWAYFHFEGGIQNEFKSIWTDRHYVWPVRGGSHSYRFVVMADSRCSPKLSHDAPCPASGSGVHEAVFKDLILPFVKSHYPEFVVFTGDMVLGESVQTELPKWVELMDPPGDPEPPDDLEFPLTKIMPVFGGHERSPHSAGNDGVWTAWKNVFDPAGNVATKRFDPEGDSQQHCWYPNNSYGDFGNTVYYCDYGNARFFVLNNDIICDDPTNETTCEYHTLRRTRTIGVASENDDAEENVQTGAMSLNSSDLELVRDGQNQQYVGIRFAGVNIPQGAIIQNAYIQFQADDDESPGSKDVDLTIQGQDVDDALPFGGGTSDISGREKTTASVAWSPLAWEQKKEAGVAQQTPDLSTIIQEIVNRSGWQQGKALAIIISESTGIGKRVAESYDGDPNGTPVLYVDYKGQLGWIKDNLVNNGKQLNFFFHHEPAYGTGAHGVWPPYAMDRHPETRDTYIRLLATNNATMIFTGHEHQYIRRLINSSLTDYYLTVDDDFHEMFYAVKTGTCGAPIYAVTKPEGMKNVVVGPVPKYHYAVVEVFNKLVSVNVFKVDRNTGAKTLIDQFLYSAALFTDTDHDGVPDFEEGKFGDWDNDETLDYHDPNTVRIALATGERQAVVHLPGGATLSNVRTLLDTHGVLEQSNKPSDKTWPFGLISMDITDITQGGTVSAGITFPSDIPTDFDYVKYNRSTNIWASVLANTIGNRAITINLTDGGTGDGDGASDAKIEDPGGFSVIPVLMNPFISFSPISSTFQYTPVNGECPDDCVGRFAFEARLTNTKGSPMYFLTAHVAALTNGNLLENADGGPGGEGSQLTVSLRDGYSDGELGPEESIIVPFTICLKEFSSFRFFVDVLGTVR